MKSRILVVDDQSDIRKGCDGYIWKPFDMGRLADEIEQVLKGGYAERAKVRRTAIGEAQMLLRQIS